MKRFLLILLLFSPQWINAQIHDSYCSKSCSGISDKTQITGYDVAHYTIHIDTIDFISQSIKGHTEVIVISQQPAMGSFDLWLLGFNIDSIVSSGSQLIYNYNDTIISIQTPVPVINGDSIAVTVYYNGQPAQDASGWGGFYFSGTYAFNLGVGFDAIPHNFGRAWYPCIDEFASKSTYDFYIRTQNTSKAFCNGTLQAEILNPDGTKTWHWVMNHPIPSYLAGIAVAPYYTLERTSSGIPVQWATLAIDTPNVLSTFSNLDTILSSFISSYGPYPFDKVGFSLIPFNNGAMEHATNIHIGKAFINGTQTYSTLWAHELSHMWWGDKVTCTTAEDMWLNEGFATYNEALYTQIINGPQAYTDWVRANHRKVLQFAHTPSADGSYLTMNNIPLSHTYGYHVYQKGADLVHTLRNYMGDSLFFEGCREYMSNLAYGNASSNDLRDQLTSGSGINMNRFFDDWIATPGFPHFSIDSVIYQPGGLDHYFIYLRQRSRGNTHLYEMPLEITLSNSFADTTVTFVMDSVTKMLHVANYFLADWISVDRYEKISDAISSNEKIISTTGIQPIPETNVTLNVQATGVSSSLVRIEHNFVTPDGFKVSNPGIRLSDYHYWKVDGLFENGFLTKATFVYDGSTSGTTGYLDNDLITGTEDSLVILYREGTWDDWEIVNSYTLNSGASLLDKRGSFTVDTLTRGEYVFGIYDYTVGVIEFDEQTSNGINIAPNPSASKFTINFNGKKFIDADIYLFDAGGRILFKEHLNNPYESLIWNGEKDAPGTYFVAAFKNGKRIGWGQMLLQK